jgi:hypothetical protein
MTSELTYPQYESFLKELGIEPLNYGIDFIKRSVLKFFWTLFSFFSIFWFFFRIFHLNFGFSAGVYHGTWFGSGPTISSYNPTTGKPIAQIKSVRMKALSVPFFF